ncbi:MAG: D-alanyl-D-alanine carboxypeptidase/D-alanyl-D-alanine-endopeptidase [Ignavibacteriales bacterium]|nr:D-alanyl-D-alanine carboxypeptidase/D-alanyl-D-alanine-endopeptidase [Ignavibacteriales bacterium]MCF8305561.1 D-alanyl-D-alanine carboxypeptidase/D-alanyl-D-alanine-endopeptidase [Ignavibacteriales bacterium]MCF8315283.1 D-alanyl-D-alanine carboxypeptidase/D-alanyl-D-alanine-endopeptidase [Ignavibacteriales bacterium]MCF8436825.1 D-alanyl-D-alanine carboxypeptidase/D-alanyl-D-alanine-endopeptidase [Ignavibacteriales bacterium]
MIKKIFAFFLLFLFIGATPGEFSYQDKLNDLLGKLPISTKYSILIYNPNTLDTLYEKNSRVAMIPASNTKIFTTAAAVNYLGKDFLVSTKLYSADAYLNDGVINGDLYLKGFGNPFFKSEDLDSMVIRLAEAGVKEIKGDIIADDSYFDKLYRRDDWIEKEKANVVLPPVSAMILENNSIVVKFNSNKSVGEAPDVELFPKSSRITLNNKVKIVSARKTPRIKVVFNGNDITINLTGSIRKRRTPYFLRAFAENPPLYAAYILLDKLKERGISITGEPTTGITPQGVIELNSFDTPLEKMIAVINKRSDNFKAECLFKLTGAEFSSKEGNSFYATQAVLNFLEEKGIWNNGTAVVDGSGISRFNEVTAAAICGVLENMYFDAEAAEAFTNSLSVSGIDGTLEDRINQPALKGKFRGKTGTLNGVSSLSGYLTTSSGEDLIISILMEFKSKGANFHRNLQDQMVEVVGLNY